MTDPQAQGPGLVGPQGPSHQIFHGFKTSSFSSKVTFRSITQPLSVSPKNGQTTYCGDGKSTLIASPLRPFESKLLVYSNHSRLLLLTLPLGPIQELRNQ